EDRAREHRPGTDPAGTYARTRAPQRAAVHRPRCVRVASSESLTDEEIVERQLGRPPRAFRGVVVRCPFGRPAVTEQAPVDDAGHPFPTQFWVTCPHLVAAISRLEAAGGVERWSRAATDDPELSASLTSAQDLQRAERPELAAGIGGSTRDGSLKC